MNRNDNIYNYTTSHDNNNNNNLKGNDKLPDTLERAFQFNTLNKTCYYDLQSK